MLSKKKDLENSYTRGEQESLDLHSGFPNGKIGVQITKSIKNALHLAYSPHVAAPCMKIASDATKALEYTNLGNSVSIITNGTAVLGLGNIGPLASFPVMEGKSALFKMLSGIDCFVNVIDSQDAEEVAATINKIRLTYSAINLEDISAPACFEICELLSKINTPVFHDDQHGTAIVICAAVSSYLDLTKKKIENVKVVSFGAGAAALATLNMLLSMGMHQKNIFLFDSKGIFYKGRTDVEDPKNKYKVKFIQDDFVTLDMAMKESDIFIGLSSGGKIDVSVVKKMSENPLVMALQNPEPEIMPEDILSIRSDVIYCSGRSDFPNQVNNVLCFPYIFRVILDFGLSITNQLMLSTSKAIVDLSKEDAEYSRKQIISKPFHPIVKYLMPVYIVKNMSMDLDFTEYAKYIALRLNKSLGMLLKVATNYIGIDNSYNKNDLKKITQFWGLKELTTAIDINEIAHKDLNGQQNIEILSSDILLCRNKDEIFVETNDENMKKIECIQDYIQISGILTKNLKSIVGVYRTTTKQCYIDCKADLDHIIMSSLIFAKVHQNE